MTGLELATYLYRAVGTSALDVLGWDEPDVDNLSAGPFQTIIDLALTSLDLDDVEDGHENRLKAVGRWKMWEFIADNVALDVDESQGDRSVSLSQMADRASKRASQAYWECVAHLPSYRVQRHTIVRKPARFGRDSRMIKSGRKGA